MPFCAIKNKRINEETDSATEGNERQGDPNESNPLQGVARGQCYYKLRRNYPASTAVQTLVQLRGMKNHQAADAALKIKRLRILREKRGMTRLALALQSRVSPPDVSRIESGRLIPYPAQLERLAAALGVPKSEAETLLTDVEVRA
jgi:ribosome-binding protein aMBF1 (putative translation factor)